MKMQVLYVEKKEGVQGNPEIIAEKISREFKCKSDKIPPAYPCDNERLVFLIYEGYGKLDKRLISFCKDLSTARASNVALISLTADGSAQVGELEGIFKANGVNIAATKGIQVKKGLFGVAKVHDDQTNEAVEFSKKVVSEYFEHA